MSLAGNELAQNILELKEKVEVTDDEAYVDGSLGVDEQSSSFPLPFAEEDIEYAEALGLMLESKSKPFVKQIDQTSLFFDDSGLQSWLPLIREQLALSEQTKLKFKHMFVIGPSEQEFNFPSSPTASVKRQARLFVMLPSSYTGGEFTMNYQDESFHCRFGELAQTRHTKPHYLAFYSDIDYQISPVMSGYMVGIEYVLEAPRSVSVVTPPPIDPHLKRFIQYLEKRTHSSSYPSFAVVEKASSAKDILSLCSNSEEHACQKKLFLLLNTVCNYFNVKSPYISAVLSIYKHKSDDSSDGICCPIMWTSDTWEPYLCTFDFCNDLIINRNKISRGAFSSADIPDSCSSSQNYDHDIMAITFDISSVPFRREYLEAKLQMPLDPFESWCIRSRIIHGMAHAEQSSFFFLLIDYLRKYTTEWVWKMQLIQIVTKNYVKLPKEANSFSEEEIEKFEKEIAIDGTIQLLSTLARKSIKWNTFVLKSLPSEGDALYKELKEDVARTGVAAFAPVPMQSKKFKIVSYSSSPMQSYLSILLELEVSMETVTQLANNYILSRHFYHRSSLEELEKILQQLQPILTESQMNSVSESIFSRLSGTDALYEIYLVTSRFISPSQLSKCMENQSVPADGIFNARTGLNNCAASFVIEEDMKMNFTLDCTRAMCRAIGKYDVTKVWQLVCLTRNADLQDIAGRAIAEHVIENLRRVPEYTGTLTSWVKVSPGHMEYEIFKLYDYMLDACLQQRDSGYMTYQLKVPYCCRFCTDIREFIHSSEVEINSIIVKRTQIDHVIAQIRHTYDETIVEISHKPMRTNTRVTLRKLQKVQDLAQVVLLDRAITTLEKSIDEFRPVIKAKSARSITPTYPSDGPPRKIPRASNAEARQQL